MVGLHSQTTSLRERLFAGRPAGLGNTATTPEASVMAVKLNRKAFEHAKDLIDKGRYAFDERDAWSEHRPSAQDENDFIERHGFDEYAKWYLGINDDKQERTKGRYEFPY